MATVEDFKLRFDVQGADKVKRVNEDINNLKGDINDLGQVGGPLGNTINGIVGRFGLLGTAAVAAGAAFVALGASALRIAGELSDIAGATGIAASQLQSLKTSIIDAGGSADDFAQVATKLNQSVQEAASGNEKLQQAFKTLGVFVTDANGNVRNTGDILGDITERFRSGEISAAQYAAAIDILGKNVNKLELSKLEALKDPVSDAEIAQLDKYNEAIDRVRASLEKSVVSFFGKLALDIEKAISAHDELEKKLNAQGKGQVAPGLTGAIRGLLGMEPRTTAPLITRTLSPEERRQFEENERRKKEAAERAKQPAGSTPNGTGGFGATPERVLKEAANRELSVFKSLNEEKKNILLQFVKDDEDAIRVRGNAEINLSRKTITDKEELSAKIREIESRRDLDIYNFRKSLQEQQAREEKRIAEEKAREEKRIDEIVTRSKAVVEEQQKLNDVVVARNKFLTDNVTATDRERQNAEALFDLEQERLQVLKQINLLKDLPADERARREAEINAEFAKRKGLVEQQQSADKKASESFSKGFEKAYRQYSEDAADNFQLAQRVFESTTKGMEDSIVNFARTGKFEWKSFVSSILEELLRAQIQKTIASTFGGGGSGGSLILGGLSSLFGRANGGPVIGNTPYLVGEQGPELFIPNTTGSISPNSALSGGAVTYNINAVDAMSFKQMIAADPTFLYAVSEQGRRRLPGAR